VISIFINLVLIRLSTGNSQPIFLPENMELALTQIIYNENEAGPQDDSDFKNEL
jgi:hypothetical protein